MPKFNKYFNVRGIHRIFFGLQIFNIIIYLGSLYNTEFLYNLRKTDHSSGKGHCSSLLPMTIYIFE